MSVFAFIALGSNLGDRSAIIDRAIELLGAEESVHLVAVSSLYETAPVGPPQPHYLNAVAQVQTTLSARALLRSLLSIEQFLGRVRDQSERNTARTIDLDILLYGDCVVDESDLELPHPRLTIRPFVLRPLLELDATLTHPVTGELLLSLLCADRENDGVVMWRTRNTQLPSRQ